MTQTIQERIQAAKDRAAKALAQAEALEKKAAEGPKRRANRSVTEINEIRLLEEQMKKRYGVGYSGLGEVVRKANKDGVPMPQPTGMAQQESEASLEPDDAVNEVSDPIPPAPEVPGVTPDLTPEPEDDAPPW